jgi:hypothetical protein
MTFTNLSQAWGFLGGIVLGGAVGVVYDLLRVVRTRLGGQVVAAVADLLFWCAAVIALFRYSLWSGNGLVRLSTMAAMLGGGVVYFATLSPQVVKLGQLGADLLGLLGHILGFPFRILGCFVKKIWKILKNLFSYWNK